MTGAGSTTFGARRVSQVVMCEPAHFRVAYEINPYMSTAVPVDAGRAADQWARLRQVIEAAGVPVRLLPAEPDLPDMVFASDVGVCVDRVFLRGAFRHPERAREAAVAAQWFADQGYRVATMPDGVVFEGMGDLAFTADGVILGHGPRSSRLGPADIALLPGRIRSVTQVELVDARFYHLGTSLAVLSPTSALVCPAALAPGGLERLRARFEHLVEVTAEEAEQFAVNVISVGSTVVAHRMPARLRGRLDALGFETVDVDVSEFVKAGGAVACLVLPLYCAEPEER